MYRWVTYVHKGGLKPDSFHFFWNSDQSELFNEHLCTTDVLHIERKFNEAESTPQSVSLELINGIVGDLCQVLERSGSDCGQNQSR